MMISNVFCPPSPGTPVLFMQILNESFHDQMSKFYYIDYVVVAVVVVVVAVVAVVVVVVVIVVFLFVVGIISDSIPIPISNTSDSYWCALLLLIVTAVQL